MSTCLLLTSSTCVQVHCRVTFVRGWPAQNPQTSARIQDICKNTRGLPFQIPTYCGTGREGPEEVIHSVHMCRSWSSQFNAGRSSLILSRHLRRPHLPSLEEQLPSLWWIPSVSICNNNPGFVPRFRPPVEHPEWPCNNRNTNSKGNPS